MRAVARHRTDEAAALEEPVARLDDAQLVALGIGEHDVLDVVALPDVEVRRTEGECALDARPLVVERLAREVEVPWVLRRLRDVGAREPEAEADDRVQQHSRSVDRVVDHVAVEQAGPEPRLRVGVVRVDAESHELERHAAPPVRCAR